MGVPGDDFMLQAFSLLAQYNGNQLIIMLRIVLFSCQGWKVLWFELVEFALTSLQLAY